VTTGSAAAEESVRLELAQTPQDTEQGAALHARERFALKNRDLSPCPAASMVRLNRHAEKNSPIATCASPMLFLQSNARYGDGPMRWFLIFSVFFVGAIGANPFRIDLGPKENLSNEDYLFIQQQLRRIYKTKFLSPWLTPEDSRAMKQYHGCRCTVGMRQTMICPEAGLFPYQELVKIGRGGDRCIMVNLEALTLDLPQFIDEYEPGMIHLEEIHSQKIDLAPQSDISI